jgi:hypothetical protein
MSRPNLMAMIAVLCVIGMAGSVAWSQSTGRDSCVESCQQAKTRCVETCDTHDNPVECDENCQETAQSCTHQCR